MKLAGAQWTSLVEMLCMGSALKTNIDKNSPYICTTVERGDQEDRKLRINVEDNDYGGNHNDYEGDVMITRFIVYIV